jgi:hypothetical protein
MYDDDTATAYWWELPKEKDLNDSTVHEVLIDTVRGIEERQFAIHELNLMNATLYSNRTLLGMDWAGSSEVSSNYAPASYTAENLIASVVDTASSLISKNWSKPTPVVKNADFKTELVAKDADQYLYGEMKRLNAWQKLQRMFNDGCWAQVGVLRVDIDHQNKELYLERVSPDNFIVDQRECMDDAEPMTVHCRRLVSVTKLKEMFPERIDDIDMVISREGQWTSYRSPGADQVVLVESHIKAHMGADGKMVPGRRCMVTPGLTLIDEKFERPKFPYLFSRWQLLPSGFYGQSLVEQVTPFQIRMNTLNRVIERSQDLMSVPRIFVEARSEIIRDQVDNVAGRFLYYRGALPTVMNWTAQNPEIYNERERVRSSAFEYAGISQLSAQAKLPDNVRLDSSKALREASLRENERFAVQAQRYEANVVDLAEHILMLSAELYGKKKGSYKNAPLDRSLIDEIDWSEVAEFFKTRRYVFQLEASSIHNMSPAAREDIINTWATQGIVDMEQYKSLLNHPDLEESMDLNSVALDDLKWTASRLDALDFMPPEPEQDLQRGIGFMQRTLLRRRRQHDCPDEVKQNYRDWIAMAQGLMDDANTLAGERQKQLEAKAQEKLAQEQAIQGGAAAQGAPGAAGNEMAQNPMAPTNVGPEGNIQPGVATTTQGVPTESLIS